MFKFDFQTEKRREKKGKNMTHCTTHKDLVYGNNWINVQEYLILHSFLIDN